MRWAEIIIETGSAAADAVGECLHSAGCGGLLIRDDPSAVVGFLPTDDRLEARLEQLKADLVALSEFGLTDASTDITLRTVEEADWETKIVLSFKC